MRSASEGDVLSPRQCATVPKALADETRLRILRDSDVVEGIREGNQVCYRITPVMQRALAGRQGKAHDFGCCELRFPESVLATAKARALQMTLRT